jgi:hypothetical protein
MGFLQLLRSLDELLYELMSWFIFFPVTMWRQLRHPLATMRYAEEQLLLEPERQYRGTVSPPIMLVLTIALIQSLDLAVQGDSSIVASHHGLAGLVNDDTSLLLLRLLLFSSFALILATRKVERSTIDLDRDSLKPAFYAQCCAISPFALLVGVGTVTVAYPVFALQLIGLTALFGAFLFYSVVQIRWFKHELGQSTFRSFVDASIGIIASVVVTVTVALLFH